jgi:hypothetical protein
MGSQPSASTLSSASPNKQQKTAYAQLIGPSFIRMQPLGFAGLGKAELDRRFINVHVSDSISDAIRTVLTEVKNTSQLKMCFREFEVPHTKPVQTRNFGYCSGVLGRQCNYIISTAHACFQMHSSASQVLSSVVCGYVGQVNVLHP